MVHYRFKPEDNHNDPKCSENETNRKNILANIKRQAEKIWEDYKKLRFLYKGIIINHNKNRANLH